MRLIKLSFFLLQLIILTINSQITHAAGISPPIPPSPATAIFVINNAGSQYDQFIPTIKDNLISSLTQKGFSIVRTENAILPTGLPDSNENKITNVEAEASLNRLAEALNARLLIVSTINSVTHDENTFDGRGTTYNVVKTTAVDNVRVNIQVYDIGTTKSVYGDSVSTSLRTPVYGTSQYNTILINLFHDATVKIADNVSSKVDSLNENASKSSEKVSFTVAANIPSVDVFIDGMVVGSAGNETELQTKPGIHQLKLGKDLIKSWEKTVNITDNAKYSVTLELSKEGLDRYQSIQKFNLAMKAGEAEIDIANEQSKARATATVEISKGERKKRENSSIKDDGFADNLKKINHGD
jgi:hypothetical protein